MKEYSKMVLEKLQDTELEILRDFVDLCERHQLAYFGMAGTGIGALRHKGFVPWDDDIDVGMPRADFERFIQLAKERYSGRYYLVNAEEYKDFPLMTTRWCKEGTVFVEESLKDIGCPLGIFLDIYPFDPLPDDERALRRQAKKAWLWSKLLILRSIARPVLPLEGRKKALAQGVCVTVHYVMSFFHIPKRWLYHRCKAACTRYRGKKTKRIGYLCDTSPYSNIVEVEDVKAPLRLEFEGEIVSFPRNLEEMLTKTYGDYMQMPPPEKRKNHYPYSLWFDDL